MKLSTFKQVTLAFFAGITIFACIAATVLGPTGNITLDNSGNLIVGPGGILYGNGGGLTNISGASGGGSTNAPISYLSYVVDPYGTNVAINYGGQIVGTDPNLPREFNLTLTTNAFIILTNGYQGAKCNLTVFQGTNNNGGWYTYWNPVNFTNVMQDLNLNIMSSVGTNGQLARMFFEYYTNYNGGMWVPLGYTH